MTIETKTAKKGRVQVKLNGRRAKYDEAVAIIRGTSNVGGKVEIVVDCGTFRKIFHGGFDFNRNEYVFADVSDRKGTTEYTFIWVDSALKEFARYNFGQVVTVKTTEQNVEVSTETETKAETAEVEMPELDGSEEDSDEPFTANVMPFEQDDTEDELIDEAEVIATKAEVAEVDVEDYTVSVEAQGTAIEAENKLAKLASTETEAETTKVDVKTERDLAREQYYEIQAICKMAEKDYERVERLRDRCKAQSDKRKAYNQLLEDFKAPSDKLLLMLLKARDRYEEALRPTVDEQEAAKKALEDIKADYAARGIKFIATVHYYPHGIEGEDMCNFTKDCKTFSEAAEFVCQEDIDGQCVSGIYDAGFTIEDTDGQYIADQNDDLNALIIKYDGSNNGDDEIETKAEVAEVETSDEKFTAELDKLKAEQAATRKVADEKQAELLRAQEAHKQAESAWRETNYAIDRLWRAKVDELETQLLPLDIAAVEVTKQDGFTDYVYTETLRLWYSSDKFLIRGDCESGTYRLLAEYDTPEQVRDVIGRLKTAAENETKFIFPTFNKPALNATNGELINEPEAVEIKPEPAAKVGLESYCVNPTNDLPDKTRHVNIYLSPTGTLGLSGYFTGSLVTAYACFRRIVKLAVSEVAELKGWDEWYSAEKLIPNEYGYENEYGDQIFWLDGGDNALTVDTDGNNIHIYGNFTEAFRNAGAPIEPLEVDPPDIANDAKQIEARMADVAKESDEFYEALYEALYGDEPDEVISQEWVDYLRDEINRLNAEYAELQEEHDNLKKTAKVA